MNKNEKLAIAGIAFRKQLKSAQETLTEKFLKPLKTWVDSKPDKTVEIAGLVKLFIRPISAIPESTTVDSLRTAADLRAAIIGGQFNLDEVKALLERDLLAPIGGETTAQALVAKGIGTMAGYSITIPAVPASYTNELRDHISNEGRFQGLERQLRRTVDIKGLIERTADEITSVRLSVPPTPRRGRVAVA